MESLMRVLHFSQSLPGGPASYVEEIASRQIEAFGEGNVLFVLPQRDRNQVPSVPDVCFRGFDNTARTAGGLFALGRFIHRAIRDFCPDIVHLHSSFAGGLGRLPLLIRARPSYGVVYCPHGWAFAGRSRGVKAQMFSLIERLLACVTDRIVTVSEFEHRIAIINGLPADKLALVRNGVGRNTPVVEAHANLMDRSKINLLFVGRHDPQKGLDIALDAMRAINRRDIHLHVLGAAVVSKPSLRQDTANVSFHGWASRERVFAFMAAADAIIMPSRWEAFGFVAAEAMRIGKPVIASNRGALPEIVCHGENGLIFNPDDTLELVRIISDLEKPDLMTLGLVGQERFHRYFTADRMNTLLIRLYSEIVRDRGSALRATPSEHDLLGASDQTLAPSLETITHA
jgi:glycosyltransferase involved in cell wall biosynthesis